MALPTGAIYFDHAATTPVDHRVVERMLPYMTELFGNPSSIYGLGRASLEAVDEAHETIARALGRRPTEIVFTGGGSEADNLAIKGTMRAKRRHGNHLITSAIEHHAVLRTCQRLEQEGYVVTYLPVDRYGRVDPHAVADAIIDETALVTIMLANNEVGTIQPIAEISRICRERRIPLHTDAVQAGGSLDLRPIAAQVDMLSLSAHKFYGPKGVGALFVRQGIRLQPQIAGGSQERNRRAGTENVPGAVGAAHALSLAEETREAETARLIILRERLIAGVLAIPGVQLTGHPTERLPNSASFLIDGVEGESLLLNLDLVGICASSGSACTTGDIEPSHVLTAMGYSAAASRGALRLTLGHSNDDADVDFLLERLPAIVARLRGMSTRPAEARATAPISAHD
ncbi:MAG TPA: cysteine desulfurase family protein [Ktedonobacterales bacterium]